MTFGCNKDESYNLNSELGDESQVSLQNGCQDKIKGKLKNDKHRQLVKKYYDKNVKKDIRLTKLGKVEWNHIITLDNYKQVVSVLPITKNGNGNRKEVTHVFVVYSNWFGHKYLIFDKAKDRHLLKDKELFDYFFTVADYVFNCDNQVVETRTGCVGILDWLFGPTVECYDFSDSFWRRIGNFFANVYDAVSDFFNEGGGGSSGQEWSGYFFFGYGYDNQSALYYSAWDGGGGGGSNPNDADPTETLDPQQMQTLQNCVNNSPAIQFTIEQILNDFVTTPNIQNIVADRLMGECNTSSSVTATQFENAVANDIIIAYLALPLFKEVAADVIAEYKYLLSINNNPTSLIKKAKFFATAYWNVIGNVAHVALDICGFIPAWGEACDLTNGVLYTIEGDYTNASFSYAAMIPFYGWVSTGTKYLAFAVKTASGKTVNLAVKMVGNVVEFGDRGYLRKALDLATGDPRQAHHLISWEHKEHRIIQEIAKNAKKGSDFFHMNHPKNGFAIEAWRQAARSGEPVGHHLYNLRVVDGLNKIQNKVGLQDPRQIKGRNSKI